MHGKLLCAIIYKIPVQYIFFVEFFTDKLVIFNVILSKHFAKMESLFFSYLS